MDPKLVFGDVNKGVIGDVSYRIAPQNSVRHAVNFSWDKIFGSAVVRNGLTAVGDRITGASTVMRGIYNFIDSAGTNTRLIGTASNGTTFFLSSGVWTATLTGDTNGLKTRYATFLDRVIRVNGTDGAKSWTGDPGTPWETTGGPLDVGSMPKGKFVIVFKAQLITAGMSDAPDDLRISSLPDAAGTAISWNTGDRTIRINPSDGGNITALGKIGSLLIVFKRYAMYRWNNRATDADQIIDIGCSSQESVATGGDMMFFFNEKGVWVTKGEYPLLISRFVQPWIDGMSASAYENVAGACDGVHYYCSIGDCTVDGTGYTNVVLRYTVATQEWAVFSYPYEFRAMSSYIDSSAYKILGASDDGYVMEIDAKNVYSDAGTAIAYEIESHDQDLGSRAIMKSIDNKAYVFGDNVGSALIQVKIDDADWQTIGNATESNTMLNIKRTLRGNLFRFRVSGIQDVNVASSYALQGLEFPSINAITYGST